MGRWQGAADLTVAAAIDEMRLVYFRLFEPVAVVHWREVYLFFSMLSGRYQPINSSLSTAGMVGVGLSGALDEQPVVFSIISISSDSTA